MNFGHRHAALFGALAGSFVFAVVAITGASVAVMYLLSLITGFVILLTVGLIGDPEQRGGRRRARRRAALTRNR